MADHTHTPKHPHTYHIYSNFHGTHFLKIARVQTTMHHLWTVHFRCSPWATAIYKALQLSVYSIPDTAGPVQDMSKCPCQRGSLISEVVYSCTHFCVAETVSTQSVLTRDVSWIWGVLYKGSHCTCYSPLQQYIHYKTRSDWRTRPWSYYIHAYSTFKVAMATISTVHILQKGKASLTMASLWH